MLPEVDGALHLDSGLLGKLRGRREQVRELEHDGASRRLGNLRWKFLETLR